MRVTGMALPDGGTKYNTAYGEFDIVKTYSGEWALFHYGQRIMRRTERKDCIRYIERWAGEDQGFTLHRIT